MEKQELKDQLDAVKKENEELKKQTKQQMSSCDSNNSSILGEQKHKTQERLKQCLEKISSLYQVINEKDKQLQVVDELKYQKDILLRQINQFKSRTESDMKSILDAAKLAEQKLIKKFQTKFEA